ncbi:hypothetical protein A3H75_03480 [Candidatus Uhrbacteria bacterium RIFCSPLOWO2_02_FULL_51_9]|uniref:Uncharacterized protein n=1 Tax=Candidatus Uhrbacteria bacterium RIFCSPLOWO2_02_FULL_51_9 TaxID=1802410 RepID=A0A1F7VDP4_9BACT|nr:MAG: hypothetical protein A3H75_03480 [Candidatus Uhrbacteria bacterium RIFCSPLOWO2_02_FULL_51_9]
MSSHFSVEFLKEIKAKLLQEQEKLERELSSFAKKTRDENGEFTSKFPDYGTDEGESAAEVAEYDTNLQIEETLEGQLRDIKKALKHLEEGVYGICKYCNKPIEERRLLARPTSGSCVSCKKTLMQEA